MLKLVTNFNTVVGLYIILLEKNQVFIQWFNYSALFLCSPIEAWFSQADQGCVYTAIEKFLRLQFSGQQRFE